MVGVPISLDTLMNPRIRVAAEIGDPGEPGKKTLASERFLYYVTGRRRRKAQSAGTLCAS